jgi:WD40 repeat protein
MKEELRFNICEMNTSYMRNDELRTYRALNEGAITAHLSYASRFGTDHLVATEFDDDIIGEVREFLHTRLLFWLEVLSVVKGMEIALEALLSIVKWSKVSPGLFNCTYIVNRREMLNNH